MTATQEFREWKLNVPSERLQRVVEQEATLSPSARATLFAELWLMRVDEFRRLEEQFLESGEYEKSLAHHRATLLQLMAEGASLINVTKEHGLSNSVEYSIADLEAVLESLHVTFHAQHRNHLPEQRTQLIEELLNA